MTDRFRLGERGWILALSELSGFFSVSDVLRWQMGDQRVRETPVHGVARPNPLRRDEDQDRLISPIPGRTDPDAG